jgi:hypothetical protein
VKGLETFDVTVNIYTARSARYLEERFRLPVGCLANDSEVHVIRAARYMDGEGVSDPMRLPEEVLGEEYIPD